MLTVADAWSASDLPEGGIVTIGNYDGVHRGQRAILDRVVARARDSGEQAVLVSFDPHPLQLLRPGEAPQLLCTPAQRERLLAKAGVDVLLLLRFTAEIARTPAADFAADFLGRRLRAREVFVGSRFSFGRDREGDVALLARVGQQHRFTVTGVEEIYHAGVPISSTRIRRALEEGDVGAAAAMLGRPYAIEGSVVRGDRMGQRLGWPTVNLEPDNELIPAHGVYACQVTFADLTSTFEAVTNVGTRPTVYQNYERVVESHILDFSANVYGQRLEVAFHKRLREERIFPSIMDLSAQIRCDVDGTREYFAALRRLEESGALPVAGREGSTAASWPPTQSDSRK